jgi:hypothetical protein
MHLCLLLSAGSIKRGGVLRRALAPRCPPTPSSKSQCIQEVPPGRAARQDSTYVGQCLGERHTVQHALADGNRGRPALSGHAVQEPGAPSSRSRAIAGAARRARTPAALQWARDLTRHDSTSDPAATPGSEVELAVNKSSCCLRKQPGVGLSQHGLDRREVHVPSRGPLLPLLVARHNRQDIFDAAEPKTLSRSQLATTTPSPSGSTATPHSFLRTSRRCSGPSPSTRSRSPTSRRRSLASSSRLSSWGTHASSSGSAVG